MKIALFTNILNPYRIAFFDKVYENAKSLGVDFKVYAMVEYKSDRPWKYNDFKREYTSLLKSYTVYIKKLTYLHFNTGLVKELDAFTPDVVIMAGSYLQPTNLSLLLLQNKYGYKTVFWSESHFNEQRSYGRIKLALRDFLRRQTIGRMDAFWYPGKKAEELIDRYRKEQSIKIQIPNTIDKVLFFNDSVIDRDIFSLPGVDIEGKKILFTPARLSHEKGILEFFEILKDIDRTLYYWFIAGDGPLREKIQEAIRKYNLNVKLLGLKNQIQIRELYKAADIFLLPSISDANPLTCVEALWMRKPLFVSTSVGNYPEVVNKDNGYVFSYDNTASARNFFMEMLLHNKNWYEKAATESYRIAKDMFDINEIANKAISETIKL